MQQSGTRFLRAADGVRIAYATHGEGSPLVFVRGWISHLELMWDEPPFRSYFQALAEHMQFVQYDSRGNGLSDTPVAPIDFDALVGDLETVIDGLDLRDIVLYGSTFGGPIALAYAARRPDRVRRLILDGTYATFNDQESPDNRAFADSLVLMLRSRPAAAYEVLDYLTRPDATSPATGAGRSAMLSMPAEVVAQLYTVGLTVDVSDLVEDIEAPALVLHRKESRSVPLEMGRQLASRLRNARFVVLDGSDHNSWEGDAQPAFEAVRDFLGISARYSPPGAPERRAGPLTILFTDVVGSTELTDAFGDARARSVLRDHERIVREALAAHGGDEVKTMFEGDGFMASFASASEALEAAIAMQRAITEHFGEGETPLRIRIGVNAGEPIAEGGDLHGTAVTRAARIMGAAGGGEIFASDVVRQLVAGRDFLFSDRGAAQLKGFDEPVRLFEVLWSATD